MIQQSPAKTKRFLKAINNAAMQKCTDIAKQIDETTKLEMARAEEEASRDGHAKITAAKEKIEANAKRTVANYELKKRKEIYQKRLDYQTAVFEEAKNQLIEFTKTDDYREFLVRIAKKISDLISENATVYLADNDFKFKDLISENINAEIITDSNIRIGGIKAFDVINNILIDDTLDTRLENQKEWFLENSDMKIEA